MSRHYSLLPDRGVLTVGGPDRVEFLQGLISNDVTRVADDRSIWAAYLTPQGKYLHDFFVMELDGVFGLDCEAVRLTDLGQRLNRHKLRAKIELGIGDSFAVLALFGADALAALELPEEAGAARRLGGGVVFVDPRLPQAGARAVLPKDEAASIVEALGFLSADAAQYDDLRLELGLSDGSRDMIVEKSVLLECNFDELHGVDWDKGCYMGQELTARTKYRGLLKKRLVPVMLEGPVPETGAAIFSDKKEVGEIRSVRGNRGLAILRLEVLSSAETGGAGLKAGETKVFPQKTDWVNF